MVSRRRVLGLAAAGAAVVGVPAVATPLLSRARASGGLPLTVVNSTGRFGNAAIRMYVVGTNLDTGEMGFVRESGRFTPISQAERDPDGYADLGVPLAGSGPTPFGLPMMSGRIYFAVNGALRFRMVPDANGRPAIQHPVGWLQSDPGFGVLHDFCEFTYTAAGMFCNTTMVDMFSIPMSIRLTGAAGQQSTGKLVDGGRDAIFAELASQPGYERLVVGDRLRVIAPGHGIESGLFAADYYDGYVGEIWDRYRRTDLRVTTREGRYTGRVVDGRLVFDGGVRAFTRPTSRDVFLCDGALAAPNDRLAGPVAAILGAGFNRSVLANPDQPVTDREAYHRQPVTNHYARVLHRHSADGRAYGFPFDDVAGHAAYLEDADPGEVTVTLTPFGAGPVADDVLPRETVVARTPEPRSTGRGSVPGGSRTVGREIAAVGFDRESGIRTEPCREGGRNLGTIADGDWVAYQKVDFGDRPPKRFQVRVASGADPGVTGLVEIRIDDRTKAPVGMVAVGSTGDWQEWRTVPGNLTPVTGVHDVYLTFSSGQPQEFTNLRWLRFER
ncbi:beta-1,3-glucanase family protein [Micromonospora echinospora]|uniref:beta-1,3-glucanase family protein n=1 Tax=Micromonospora echinospora TaxID=1877 RepID=UPI00366A8383